MGCVAAGPKEGCQLSGSGAAQTCSAPATRRLPAQEGGQRPEPWVPRPPGRLLGRGFCSTTGELGPKPLSWGRGREHLQPAPLQKVPGDTGSQPPQGRVWGACQVAVTWTNVTDSGRATGKLLLPSPFHMTECLAQPLTEPHLGRATPTQLTPTNIR